MLFDFHQSKPLEIFIKIDLPIYVHTFCCVYFMLFCIWHYSYAHARIKVYIHCVAYTLHCSFFNTITHTLAWTSIIYKDTKQNNIHYWNRTSQLDGKGSTQKYLHIYYILTPFGTIDCPQFINVTEYWKGETKTLIPKKNYFWFVFLAKIQILVLVSNPWHWLTYKAHNNQPHMHIPMARWYTFTIMTFYRET